MNMKQNLILASLMMLATSMACAGEKEAYLGTAADAASTAAALATPGFVETNPLGWATVPLRIAAIQYAKSLPREEGQPIMDGVSATSWGAATSNLLMLAGMGAAAPIVGIAVGYSVWKKGETEREFWHLCKTHQRLDPAVKCQFRAWKPQEVVQVAQAQYAQRVAAAPAMIQVSASANDKPMLAPAPSNL
jgi:hypothetical protein